ncbi:MAG TPA: LacI family DNA-binding transcriptional regulator [Roseiflexaceae bacterium]|nr:LacI family DNA-binding transcriptional regulator [Roseiflexaceae bacterium]
MRRSTIREVALRAGVSHQTVSRVINNSPDVAEATRELVMRVIAELDYHPNAQAVGLSRNRSDIVGVVVDTVTEPFFSHILDGVLRGLRSRGRLMLLATVDNASQLDAIDALQRSRRIDGLVIVLPLATSLDRVRMVSSRVPTVHVDLQYDLDDVSGVSVNNFQGAYIAVQHLIDLGHRRIGIITGRRDIPVGQVRLDGYLAALRDYGIPFDEALVARGDFSHQSGRAGAEELFGLETPPTAIFACDDQMAFGAIHALRQRGVRVPEDCSVIGFDDTFDAARFSPPLTTVHQPLREMGELAAEFVCRLIDGQALEQPRVTLDTHLVIRESTAPARFFRAPAEFFGAPPRVG